jgi:hypothetical protein
MMGMGRTDISVALLKAVLDLPIEWEIEAILRSGEQVFSIFFKSPLIPEDARVHQFTGKTTTTDWCEINA